MVFIDWAIDVLHWDFQKDAIANLEKILRCRLFSEIRKYEGGIASNRK